LRRNLNALSQQLFQKSNPRLLPQDMPMDRRQSKCASHKTAAVSCPLRDFARPVAGRHHGIAIPSINGFRLRETALGRKIGHPKN